MLETEEVPAEGEAFEANEIVANATTASHVAVGNDLVPGV